MIPRPEEFELFKIRLGFGLAMPPLIIAGVDNVETRHSVQRLWPSLLIDMGSRGLNSQVLVRGRRGLCLLKAFTLGETEKSWAERLGEETGLRSDRILRDPSSQITKEDVEIAPPEYRAQLERARRQGDLICGRLTDHNLTRVHGEDFAPAVPFVTTWSGIVAAAETMKALIGKRHRGTLHYQRSFLSGRSRATIVHCEGDCECNKHVDAA